MPHAPDGQTQHENLKDYVACLAGILRIERPDDNVSMVKLRDAAVRLQIDCERAGLPHAIGVTAFNRGELTRPGDYPKGKR